MDWAQVLVIILSVFLTIFLLLGIMLAVMLIKVTRQIKIVTNSAQRTAQHVEGVVMGFAKITSPLLLLRTIMKQVKRIKKNERR